MMESRVMGNCHARFGAGENLEVRVCSLRLHTLTKGLPIAILDNGCRRYGIKAARTVQQISFCSPQPFNRAMGKRIFAALPCGKYPCCDKERF